MSNLLNLGCYSVLSIKETDHDYHIKVETTQPPTACEECGSANIVGGGRHEVVVRDTTMHGKRVSLYIQARRISCRSCGKTLTEKLPEVYPGYRVTTRLYAYITRQSLQRTNTSVSAEVGVSEGTVRNIFGDYQMSMAEAHRFDTPEWLGLDEIHVNRHYYAVLSNLETTTVFDLLPHRTKLFLQNYMMKLPNRHSVKCVTIDMCDYYRDIIKGCLPKAVIVVDKFHVVKMASYCMDEVRKKTGTDLPAKQRKGLKNGRFALLKRPHSLQMDDLLEMDAWLNNFPRLKAAYEAKERFYRIYDCMTVSEAQDAYMDWLRSLTPETREDFSALITAVTNWHHEIMMHFEHPVTNAYTESLNNLIRVIQRMGRGYKFEALRARVLYNHSAHKVIAPKPDRIPSGGWGYVYRAGVESTQAPKNYGVVTSTLLELLDKGLL